MRKISVVFLILISVGRVAGQSSDPILFREKSFDFGEISEGAGPVMHEFSFTNLSGRPIKILSVQASCGCTTSGWSQEPVPHGKSGFVKANFDPSGRPGYFSKALTVTTDLDGNAIVLQIKGNVTDGKSGVALADWPEASGNLRLKASSFNLGKVFINKEAATVTFKLFNAGSQVIHLNNVQSPKYLKLTAPQAIKAGEVTSVTIQFDARAKGQYGFVSENITLDTDDELAPTKSFSVYATVEENFPQLSPDELAKSPTLSLQVGAVEFGSVKTENTLQREVSIRNTGKRELIIRALQSNCNCLTYEIDKQKLAPGQEALLKLILATSQRTGPLQKAITIYSTDPKAPVQRITVTALVH